MNDRVKPLLFNISRNSLFREIHYIATLSIIKGAGICSLYHEIHYIEIRYIEVWVYYVLLLLTSLHINYLLKFAKKIPMTSFNLD